MMTNRLPKYVAWSVFLLIVIVTVCPIGFRPHTLTTVGLDRAAAFAFCSAAFVLAYPRYWLAIIVAGVAALLLAGGGAYAMRVADQAGVGAAAMAKVACSCVFVDGRSLEACRADDPPGFEQIAVEIVQKHGLLVDESLEQTRALCAELLGQHAKSMEALDAVLQASKRRWWNTQPLRDAALVAAETIAQKLGRRISPAGEVI